MHHEPLGMMKKYVSVAHEVNQPQMTMGQYWLGKTKPITPAFRSTLNASKKLQQNLFILQNFLLTK